MKINYELLRTTIRERVEVDACGNLSRWCRQGRPALKQSTIHKFLSGERGLGIDGFFDLCERMDTRPSFFYTSSATSDALRDRLALLMEMVSDPIFPFGKEDLFYNLADQIDSLYHKYLEAKRRKTT